MPVSFVRLRIAGFKSFAEPAVVEILPGLTGIVGPNGCGKSNVVEALRWAMGETSARALRGGEMDDVIFAGTANRPSRNLAEVTLSLEDAAGLAPPPFHELHELQISRRIERGSGSTFRVNGREARARDVQTLFADLASGARASAMVSQGRVASIVNARPDERRGVLEEAAGITGLHARRHEAELKLRAAEANSERAEDLRGQLEGQLDGLRRQARQAARFRAMNGMVAAAEGELLALQRARVHRDRDAAASALAAAREAVAAATAASVRASGGAALAEAALPPLREAEATARTRLERARVQREGIEDAWARAQKALEAAAQRRTQIARDLGHAEQARTDAAQAAIRLEQETAALAAADAGHAAHEAELGAAARTARTMLEQAEAEAQRLTEHAAALGARRDASSRRLADAQARARRADEQHARLASEHEQQSRRIVDPVRLDAAEQALASAAVAQHEALDALDAAERARATAGPAAAAAREALQAADATRARHAAEASGLAEVLASGVHKSGDKRWPPMVDALKVPPGLEAALAAALGEGLEAAEDTGAARHWRPLPPMSPRAPLPAPALDSLMDAPPALRRALEAVAVVADAASGDAAQPGLAPGQSLVSREGGFWRWDGYTVRAGAPSAAAVRLQQRNRLAASHAKLAEAEIARDAARTVREREDAAERESVAQEARARTARRDADAALERHRADTAALRLQADSSRARLSSIAEAQAQLNPERLAARSALAAAEAEGAELPDSVTARQDMDRARRVLAQARQDDAAAQRALDVASREHRTRQDRARSIGAEAADWRLRAADAAGRVLDLSARAGAAEREHQALAAEPERERRAQADATDALERAEAGHRQAADALLAAQNQADATARASRAGETALSAARESGVRAEASQAQAEHAWGVMAERILERLGTNPSLPNPPADLSAEAEERARRRLDRLQREREEMGPVNLRAEIEAEAIATQMDTIVRERDELAHAIAKLRGSIGHLNREGRERLNAVFTEVDRHFQALFGRMFGGGRAHLAMVGSDDPLVAGLEIYAQPPGKKLATLSLLSGGEQALTALSLIFAVFRCNPAPVCVLDEVDAPLDDANVERFCTLLDDIVRETATRFLVVTHHPHTMARMDRLFGVTMQERGVSRVLSVDLQRAAAMVERAVAAE